MRRNLLLLAAAGLAIAGLSAGCSDGEEGGGGGAGGGDGGGGTGGTGACPSATFTNPTAGQVLTAVQDSDGDCSNGISLDVTVATSAPAGTTAILLGDGQQVGSATVGNAIVQFKGVVLQSTGATKLAVRFGGDADCDVEIDVTQACGSKCEISKPVLSPTHPKLNGVPATEGGDRASAAGQDYQVAFEVGTDIEDGQPVSLTVDGKAQTAVAIASAGVAKFPGVTLTPDGDHKVQATCTPKAGETGASSLVTFPVDTTPPLLQNVAPKAGEFFGPSDDSNSGKTGLQFKVCGETTSTDAVDLPTSLGGGENNFCVGIGTATPICVAAKKAGVGSADGGCVELDCPGGAPFDLAVTLKDEAGNPTKQAVVGVRCASSLPSVQIVEPVDGTGSDVSKHLLAASSSQARKDQDANKAGAQYTVVACTDVTGGSTALKVGLVGGTPVSIKGPAPTPAQAGDNCPSGLGNVVKFTNADLDESAEDALGALAKATELTVEVTDVSTAVGKSPAVQVWVDSNAPTITENSPNPLCGKLYQSTGSVQQSIQFVAQAVPLDVKVTNSNGTQSFTPGTAVGVVSFGPVTFAQGQNTVTATTVDPAGNPGALKSPCVVTVGNPPIVTWVSPAPSASLNATSDGAPGTVGWQGTVTVQTDLGGTGATVDFSYECGATQKSLGTGVAINASGVATLAGVTLDDCPSAKIIATTSNVAGKGVGTASLTKLIDTLVPSAPTGLAAAVTSRRGTTFGLTWTAPGDGGQAVSSYLVKVSKQAITPANFDAAESVAFGGSPKAPGGSESLDVANRVIETDYYFAVAAADAAGNRSAIASAGPAKATFNSTVLTGSTGEGFGYAIDGSSSLNGDTRADLIVGTRFGTTARAYFGAASGYSSTPSVTFSGVAGTRFGYSVAVVGDIDSDGLDDVGIGAPLEGSKGRVYIYKGRASWPSNLSSTQADYVIDVDNTASGDTGFTNSVFGWSLVPLGDFNGDGADDFAIGAVSYKAGNGYVAIIYGVTTGNTFPASVVLPAALGTRASGIAGPTGTSWLGAAGAGLSAFYSGGAPALVVGAALAGQLYAFKGGTAQPATIALGSGELYAGSAALRTGYVVKPLGGLFGVPAVAAGSPANSSSVGGDARLFFGNAASGVFAGTVATFTNAQANVAGDQFGAAAFGGGFSGSTVSVSLINGPQPDVVLSSAKLGGAVPSKLYIIDGTKANVSADAAAVADVAYTLPAGWLGAANSSTPVRDHDGDTFADIAVGEQQGATSPVYDGRVLVLW